MRFTKILHPEITLNKRGEKVSRQIYQDWFKLISLNSFNDNGWTFELNYPYATTPFLKQQIQIIKHDEVLAKHICLIKKFVESQEKRVYHFGKALTQDLSKIDKEIPLDLLPESFLAYISFPPETISDEDGFCEGGYVGVFPAGSLDVSKMSFTKEEQASRVLWLTYQVNGIIASYLVPLVTTKLSDINLENFVHDYSFKSDFSVTVPSEDIQKLRSVIYRTLFNCVLFLSCKNAEIEIAKPATQTGLSNKEILRRGGVINECTLPITFVNRAYHGIQYSKDSTHVRSHLRFQRCGPAYSQIELITVKAHERHFSKEEIT